MVKTPDFDQIATAALDRLGITDECDAEQLAYMMREIVTELRDVWNARGAADLKALDTEIGRTMSSETDVRPYLEQLVSALRTLDR